ncbi:MAG: phosphoglycerate mutase, partial [Lysobacter sp.]
AALLAPLKPIFGDTGFPIDAATPSHWYLRLPLGAKLPQFTGPDDALGADVFDHLPEGGEGRRWRALLSEAQVVLHNHPCNAERSARGLPPINSLWFWGPGPLPDHVRCHFNEVCSDDDAVQAFAFLAGVAASPLPPRWSTRESGAHRAVDLRRGRDLAVLQADWFAPLMADLWAGSLDSAILDFADGVRYTLEARQRWRFWRRPLRALDA